VLGVGGRLAGVFVAVEADVFDFAVFFVVFEGSRKIFAVFVEELTHAGFFVVFEMTFE
jgi:hypothetical protein